MNGIEKITDKIIAEAHEYEIEVINKAEAQAESVLADYKSRAETIKESQLTEAEKNAKSITERAISSSQLMKRNMILSAKNEIIEQAFTNTLELFRKLPVDEYTALLVRILCGVITANADSEADYIAKYGRDNIEITDEYILFLNEKDRTSIGELLINNGDVVNVVQKYGHKLTLSSESVSIAGGFILRYGDIETNCAMDKMIDQLRGTLKSKIYKELFG